MNTGEKKKSKAQGIYGVFCPFGRNCLQRSLDSHKRRLPEPVIWLRLVSTAACPCSHWLIHVNRSELKLLFLLLKVSSLKTNPHSLIRQVPLHCNHSVTSCLSPQVPTRWGLLCRAKCCFPAEKQRARGQRLRENPRSVGTQAGFSPLSGWNIPRNSVTSLWRHKVPCSTRRCEGLRGAALRPPVPLQDGVPGHHAGGQLLRLEEELPVPGPGSHQHHQGHLPVLLPARLPPPVLLAAQPAAQGGFGSPRLRQPV